MLDLLLKAGAIGERLGRRGASLFNLAHRCDEKPRRSGEILVTRRFNPSTDGLRLDEVYQIVDESGALCRPMRVTTYLGEGLKGKDSKGKVIVLTHDAAGFSEQNYVASTFRNDCSHVDLRPLCDHPVSIAFLIGFAAQAGHSRSLGLFLDRIAFLESRKDHNEAVAALAAILL